MLLKAYQIYKNVGSGGIDKNGNICFEAHLLFKIAPPLLGGGQDINNIGDINKDTGKFIMIQKIKMKQLMQEINQAK